jgi:hypothetical protein
MGTAATMTLARFNKKTTGLGFGDEWSTPSLRTDLTKVLPHSNFFMMLPKQLPADHILVLGDNANQPIHIFSMVSYQFGQLLYLLLQLFKAPSHVAQWV